jgi:hypothetical protein
MKLAVDCVIKQIKNKYTIFKCDASCIAIQAQSDSTVERDAERIIGTSEAGIHARIRKTILCNVKLHKHNLSHQTKDDETLCAYRAQ